MAENFLEELKFVTFPDHLNGSENFGEVVEFLKAMEPGKKK